MTIYLWLGLLLTETAGTMRSAILQPDVPTHMFPAKKATENSKAQPGKPTSKSTSKRTSSKAKTGSKRRASETGFDEFGDASIDDADLVLAENGGFENIDDFDDEARPNSKAPRKKQKVSNTQDVETASQEPRQLENGKWACNHNCKDKKNCKHLCCREGLDKPRKPSKPRTGRKERDTSADPKQTQLSMPVSKGAKAPAATQSPQTERSMPAPQRNPPKGPEMYNLNTLHNNVKSNTQSIPLLSASSSRTYKASSPVVLPHRPAQSRTKNSEAARRAAQSVYSDEFDDIDDMSLFDEPAAPVAPTRPSPPPQPESDLFETDFGDMLDDFPPAAKDDPLIRIPAKPQDDQAKAFPSHDFDDDIIMLSAEQHLGDSRKPDPGSIRQSAGKPAAPFLETSSDSAAFDLGFTKNQAHSSTIANKAIGNVSAVSKGHEPPHDNTVNRDVVEERPTSSDSATKFFMEELGTDLFNYVG
jgi:hypothetical protein